jgi:hypothetical protein
MINIVGRREFNSYKVRGKIITDLSHLPPGPLRLDSPPALIYSRNRGLILVSEEKNEIYRVDPSFDLSVDQILRRLRFRSINARLEGMVRELAVMARAAARPRGIYRTSPSRVIDDATVEVDGVRFTSRALSRNLRDQTTVYPFIATAGRELDELPLPPGDVMRQYYLDLIKTVVLVWGVDYLADRIRERYSLGFVTHMNPGELEDWPITEQRPLFSLFGGAEKQIGVELTDSGVMKPIKSRSGIIFPSESRFVSCLLCTQEKCPGRRAKYDPVMVEEWLGTTK